MPGTGLARHVVYWRDSLHEGPVPSVGPEELRRIRADFLARSGAGVVVPMEEYAVDPLRRAVIHSNEQGGVCT